MALPARPTKGQVNAFDTFEGWAAGVSALAEAALPVKGSLGTLDLNTVRASGIYFQQTAGSAALDKNYPVVALIGVLEVVETTNTVLQRWTITQEGSVPATRGVYERSSRNSSMTWTPWTFISSQRIDLTVGRAFYSWDHVAQREQLDARSDTGVYDVLDLLKNGWTAVAFQLARYAGYQVEMRIVGLSGAAATSGVIATLPTGFQIGSTGAGPRGLVINPAGVVTGRIQLGSDINANSLTVSGDVTLLWRTNQQWPTVEPSTTKVGTIPNL
ncbi:pyocin knob domain-containing protein [Timonella senegalensis]|uniref:pyocin knob domain-containing protein n=1 Tax=Timonella senegalensis TaxID=1465825 RepID=UPI002FDE1BF6